ncbi:hypothetical protein ACVILK_003519 [Bradyrhizobium embrapense]
MGMLVMRKTTIEMTPDQIETIAVARKVRNKLGAPTPLPIMAMLSGSYLQSKAFPLLMQSKVRNDKTNAAVIEVKLTARK